MTFQESLEPREREDLKDLLVHPGIQVLLKWLNLRCFGVKALVLDTGNPPEEKVIWKLCGKNEAWREVAFYLKRGTAEGDTPAEETHG